MAKENIFVFFGWQLIKLPLSIHKSIFLGGATPFPPTMDTANTIACLSCIFAMVSTISMLYYNVIVGIPTSSSPSTTLSMALVVAIAAIFKQQQNLCYVAATLLYLTCLQTGYICSPDDKILPAVCLVGRALMIAALFCYVNYYNTDDVEMFGLYVDNDEGDDYFAPVVIVTLIGLLGWSKYVDFDYGPIQDTVGSFLQKVPSTCIFPLAATNAVCEEAETRLFLYGGMSALFPDSTLWRCVLIVLQGTLFAMQHVSGGFPQGIYYKCVCVFFFFFPKI